MPYKSKEMANKCKKQWRLNNPEKTKKAGIKHREQNPQQRLLPEEELLFFAYNILRLHDNN